MKLDIGCGRSPKAGYIGVDIVADTHPDIVAPMWEIPVSDNTVDEIFSTHALEHVSKNQVIPTLREWLRLLRPGGKARIEVPDLAWCCRNWLDHRSNDWHMDTIFGNQEHEGEFHKTGFTYEIMRGYLGHAGFVLDNFSVIQSHGQDTLVFEAHKP
jgi:predicted SAM-dependent methyltransferase